MDEEVIGYHHPRPNRVKMDKKEEALASLQFPSQVKLETIKLLNIFSLTYSS